MAGTQLFSLRIPADIMVAVDERAALENRSRAQVIIMVLQEALLGSRTRTVPAAKKRLLKTDAVATTGAKVTIAQDVEVSGQASVVRVGPDGRAPLDNLLRTGAVVTGNQIPKPSIYEKPAHAENCKCYSCRPPRVEK